MATIDSFLGEGIIWVDRLTSAGVGTGIVQLGNSTKFALQAQAEIKEQISRMKGTYGQVLASAVLPQPGSFSMTLNQLDKNAFAMIFLGTSSDVSVTSAAVVEEDVTAPAILDRGVLLANKFIDSGETFTVEDSTTTTTYVEDTDYTVDYTLGLLTILSTGSITASEALKVSYTYEDQSGYKVEGMTESTVLAKLILEGRNFVNGKNCIVTVDKVRLMPTSEVDFLMDDFAGLEFEGTMETVSGASSPFRVEYID